MLREPHATALLLLLAGGLVIASVLVSQLANRFSFPVTLLFLAVGMLAGSEGLGLDFEDYGLAYRLGTIALVLILFDGGLNTPLSLIRKYQWPSGLLATVGVVLTALVLAGGGWLLGLPVGLAVLIGAVTSSTDAALVFAVLRASGLRLRERVAGTLEVESVMNDPMAVILTTALTELVLGQRALGPVIIGHVLFNLIVGAAWGGLVGLAGHWLLARVPVATHGLMPVGTTALAGIAYGGATLIQGSGFLGAFVAGVVVGSGELPYRPALVRVHDALAWLGQVSMFVVLGLLATPSRVLAALPVGLPLALILGFVARPIATIACIFPFRYKPRELAFVSWAGLRGAVPIILATYPVLAGVPDARRLVDIVFFVVVVNAFLPGATLRTLTRRLGMASGLPSPPTAALEIISRKRLTGDLLSFTVEKASAVSHVALSELPFPEGAAAVLVIRGDQLIAPRGHTVLQPNDHVYVFCRREDRPFIELLFGRRQEP